MRVTAVQSLKLKKIHEAGEIESTNIARVTSAALLKRGLIESCPRLYFGPRSLRYRLTDAGKQWVKDHE